MKCVSVILYGSSSLIIISIVLWRPLLSVGRRVPSLAACVWNALLCLAPSHAVGWLCLTAGWQIRRQSVRRCRFGRIDRFPRAPTGIYGEATDTSGQIWIRGMARMKKNEKKKSHKCVLAVLIVYIFPIYSSGVHASCVLTLWVALPIQQMLPMISASCAVWWPSRYASPLCVQSAQWLCQQLASLNALLCFGHSNVGHFFLFISKSPFKGSRVSFFFFFFFVISGLCSHGSLEGRRIFSPLCTVFQ